MERARENSGSEKAAMGRVAWFSFFPVEWLPDLPDELRALPKQHPATWQRVLWEEFQKDSSLHLDIIIPRGDFRRSMVFERGNTRFHCLRTPPALRAGSLYWVDTWLVGRALRRIRPRVCHAWGTEFGSAAVAGRLKYPTLVTVQGILTWLGETFPLNRHQRISRFLEGPSLRRARLASCESSFAMKYLGERYPRLKLVQIEHAPHPLFAEVLRQPKTSPCRLLSVGSFNRAKGADLVMKALDGVRTEFELIWIGGRDHEFEEGLRAETSPELWRRVDFKHDLTPAQIAEELARATLFLHAARADNSPNSVKEAVVAGVPVIATRTGGIPDYVVPGENGLLFSSGDWADCRDKIAQALGDPMFASGRVATATLSRVREYLSARTMARKFKEAYRLAAG